MRAQPTPPPADHPLTQDAQANRDALNELRDMGMDIARTIHARRNASGEPDALVKVAAAFDRVSRAVRRTILLLQHLHDPAQ